jgi:DNA-binding MarR family transcriptional regulator
MGQPPSLEQALRDWAQVFMHRSVREFQDWIKESGLSHSQLATLMQLHRGGSCPVTGIGQDLGVTSAAASQIVDRLVQQGLLSRTEDEHDRRVRQITLTPAGHDIVRQAIESRMAWMRQLVGALRPEEQQAIIGSLDHLTRAARALEEDTGAFPTKNSKTLRS